MVSLGKYRLHFFICQRFLQSAQKNKKNPLNLHSLATQLIKFKQFVRTYALSK